MEQCQTLRLLEIEKAEAELHWARAANMPHRVYQPILNHDGLEWVATWGLNDSGKPLLVGRGDCPGAALLDFDFKWTGAERTE